MRKTFSNARNFVAGVVNSKTVDISKVNDMRFVAYEVIKPELKPSKQMELLTSLNVEVVRNVKTDKVTNELSNF